MDRALGFLTEHTVKLLKQLSLTEYAPSEEALGEFGYFGLLPVRQINRQIENIQTGGWTENGWIDGQTNRQTDRWMGRWTVGWIDGRTDRQLDRHTDG